MYHLPLLSYNATSTCEFTILNKTGSGQEIIPNHMPCPQATHLTFSESHLPYYFLAVFSNKFIQMMFRSYLLI